MAQKRGRGMKRIVSILLIIVLCFSFASCKKRTEINKQAIDKKFTAEHYSDYFWYTTIVTGKSVVMVPHYMKQYHPDSYEILYLITYDDGEQKEKWETVTEEEYNEVNIND